VDAVADALARLYDLDLAEDPGDTELYLALATRAGDPIVELATGTGRVAVPLAAAGHQVVGIDIDPAMLARARRRAAELSGAGPGRLELVEGDALVVRRRDAGRFGLAILALNSILLFSDRHDQARVIRRMADLVRPGGLVVVDAWQPQPIDLVRMDGRLSLEWLRADPETDHQVSKVAAAWYEPTIRVATVTTVFEEGGPGEPAIRWTRTDRLRLASGEELIAWAEVAGLEVERLGGDHDLAPYGPGSDRAVLIARKPA
jgi:SAM-dependent methyltransferase